MLKPRKLSLSLLSLSPFFLFLLSTSYLLNSPLIVNGTTTTTTTTTTFNNNSTETTIEESNIRFLWKEKLQFEELRELDNILISSIAQDPQGNSYICGSFRGLLFSNPNSPKHLTKTSDSETFFLVKYSSSGRMLFTVTSDDPSSSSSSSSTTSRCSYVGVRADGDPVVLGWFSGTDFGIGGYGVTLGNEEPGDKGGEALFVVRFSHSTGSVASFQEVVSCDYGKSDSVRKEEANSVRIQAADLDCRAGKMTIAAVFSGVCRVKASSGEEAGGGNKKEMEIEEVGMGGDVMQIESVSEIGDGLVLVFDDHIDAEKMRGEIVNLVIVRSNNQHGAILFDSIGIGGAVHLPSTSTPSSSTSHHSLSSGVSSSAALQMHMTETQVFAALRVVDEGKGKKKGEEGLMVYLDSTTETFLEKDGVLLVSWVWRNDHPSVLWVNTFKESKVKTICQLLVDNPTYRLPDVDHRADEVVFVLGSYDQGGLAPALPFIQKFKAIDGELLWKRTLGEVSSSSSSSQFHLSLDVLRFYRSDLILGGRLFSSSSSVTPSDLTTTLVDDPQRKATQTVTPLSVSAFYAAISEEVAFTSEIQPVKLNLKVIASTNFASADSRTMIVTDVTSQISLFAASLYRVREDQQRSQVFGEEKRGGVEILIYLARTTYDGQVEDEGEGEGEEGDGKGEGRTNEEGGTSFVEMLLRVHHHHPDWNDRMGLSGVSNGSLFLAVLVVFCYVGLIIYLTRKCQTEYSTEQFVPYCPPPRCIDPYSSSSSGATV